jgi:hypothetical protein
LFLAPWLFWVASWPQYALESLFTYYAAYDLSGAEDPSAWLARHWEIVLGNARYLVGAFDFLYLLPLLLGLGLLVAVLTAVGMIVSARREDVVSWWVFLTSTGFLLLWPFHPGRYLARSYLCSFCFYFVACGLLSNGLIR